MSNLITLQQIEKRHGAQLLFSGVSFSIFERERLGVIGPNGAGKSTLLRIIAGESEHDGGSILRRKDLRVSYAAQHAAFVDEECTALELAQQAARRATPFPAEQERLSRSALAALSIDYFDAVVKSLSGGQRKRLQLALSFAEAPDLLLLDEPTNHLDIESILDLEETLNRAAFAWVVVSHDRFFLENSVSRILEVSPRYSGGIFLSEGGYGDYLERREQHLAAQEKQRESLENVVRNEQAWLRQGVKARGTKAKSRIDKAYQLMESLAMVRARDAKGAVQIAFDASDRKTKRLLELHGVSKSFGDKQIVQKLTLTVLAGSALGVLGLNGSGKTTFVRMLSGDLTPDEGTIKPALGLSVAHFTQFEEAVPADLPLKQLLAPEGESVVYRGNALHVASWARRFNFSFEQLHQPYGTLSGGERARARIAKLMLENPDLLILDEPTNDLDIETLETLETSLLDFKGAVVLVTHDRFMINRVCTSFLGLDGRGGAKLYASYEQWEREVLKAPNERDEAKPASAPRSEEPRPAAKKRLGYIEQREYDGMEAAINTAEAQAAELQAMLSRPEVQIDAQKLQALCTELDTVQEKIEALYARWAELEQKQQ